MSEHSLEFNKKKFIEEELINGLILNHLTTLAYGSFNGDVYEFNENPDDCDDENTYNTTNITKAKPIYYIENNVKSNDFEKCMERINTCESDLIYIKYDVTFEIENIKVMFDVYHKYYRTTVDNTNVMQDVFEVYYKNIDINYDPFYYCKYSNDK